MQLLIQHIRRVHAHSANFRLTCGVNGCQCVYTNFRRFREHLKKKHGLPQPQASDRVRTEELGLYHESDDMDTFDQGKKSFLKAL